MEAADILLIVIAFCVLWVTAFVCWFIYHLAMMLRSLNDVLQEVRFSIEKVEQALQAMKMKVEKGSGHLSKMSGYVRKAAENVVKPKKK
ncbi:hypothetical protein HON52_03055 [Candidatus Uhrbacteria bacterium]|jgi:hypothetical protein|nr:hypothetical protein [Candidatus Uhrbacteria bacterium]